MNYTLKKEIFIVLNHTIDSKYGNNKLNVSGYDEIWVNGFINMVEVNVKNWKPQKKWPYRYKWPLIIIFSIGFGLLYFNLLKLIFNTSATTINPFLFLIVGFWFEFMPSEYIVNKICKLYPSIEFVMGPEHLHTEEEKRKKVYQFITIGIIPLIISLLMELIRYII